MRGEAFDAQDKGTLLERAAAQRCKADASRLHRTDELLDTLRFLPVIKVVAVGIEDELLGCAGLQAVRRRGGLGTIPLGEHGPCALVPRVGV